MKQTNWTRVLVILLVILASYAIVYITGTILLRFTQAILLFVLGAMLAYILNPLVNRLEAAFHLRWLAVLFAYGFVAIGLVGLGVLLFTPFIQQSRSLIDNLHNPSAASLSGIKRVQGDANALVHRLQAQSRDTKKGIGLSDVEVASTSASIDALRGEVERLRRGTLSGPHSVSPPVGLSKIGKQPPNPASQTQMPSSFVNNILTPVEGLEALYATVYVPPQNPDKAQLRKATSSAGRVQRAATSMYHTMATTPILLLHAQAWLDNHNVGLDLPSKFGEVANQASNQGTSILDNAIVILSKTASILLNLILILIISVYLVSDGTRMLRGLVLIIPPDYREQAWFFISSLDNVLGGYIRGQLFLSALAGVLGGGAAAILGVPFPLLIGLMTFILESIPVIGPLVAVVPAVGISLFFNPLFTTVLMLAWFVVYQQIVTNVIGPRIMGMAVGIHPLEALAAVLVGYPLGGLLGAFLAVPIAGVVHIVIREVYAYLAHGKALPTAPVPASVEEEEAAAVMTPVAPPAQPQGATPSGT